MNRRRFLKALGLSIGGVALDQAVPLGRVWSFPTQIARTAQDGFWLDAQALAFLRRELEMIERGAIMLELSRRWEGEFPSQPIGSTVRVRMPLRYSVASAG